MKEKQKRENKNERIVFRISESFSKLVNDEFVKSGFKDKSKFFRNLIERQVNKKRTA